MEILKSKQVEVYSELDGYTIPLLRRIEASQTPIRQFINGEMVAAFHQMTDGLVHQIISTRVTKGLEMRNLIREQDQHLEIELSNPQTLKETRLLPKDFEGLNVMFAVFGDIVTLTSLDEEKPLGLIITNSTIASAFKMIFDSIWERSTPK